MLEVPLAACAMRRERKVSPTPGLMQSVVVVVSFHHLFMTKVDRAYSVRCYYAQSETSIVGGMVTVRCTR